MRPIYIFDLDGTLADAKHRIHYISGPKKDWRAFFAACIEDKPISATFKTFQMLIKAGAEIWIWTGRSDEVRADTVTWLREHLSFDARQGLRGMFSAPERFLMRKAGDHRPDHELKAEWLSMVEPPEYARLTAVFEDRTRVVQMWRDAGVQCFQVAPGDF